MQARPSTPKVTLDARAVGESSSAALALGLRTSPDPGHQLTSSTSSTPSTPTLRRSSHSGQHHLGLGTPPLRRAASFASSSRVVGLGLSEGSEDEASTGETVPSSDMSTLPSSLSPATSALLLSPTVPSSPDTFSTAVWSSSASNIVPTSVACRSPRTSCYLDPPNLSASRRTSSNGHSSHSSNGSGASFHSTVSIRMDGEGETSGLSSSQRSASGERVVGSNYWLPGADDGASSSPISVKESTRSEKRKPSGAGSAPSRSVLHFLLGPFATLLLPSAADSAPSKRALPTRLLNAAYVIFSLLFLTSQLLAPYTPETPPIRLLKRTPPIEESPHRLRPRQWGLPDLDDAKVAGPLSPMRHTHRFSKMHSKIDAGLHDNISPFAFRASNIDGRGEVTACVYTNEAWLSELPEFVRRWGGPVSAVVELPYDRMAPDFSRALALVGKTRSSEPLVKQLVDFHVIASPPASELQANRTRQRLISQPVASNFQLNTARFFSRTSMVWLVGDARILPSAGLRKRLGADAIAQLVLERADAVVVPTFAVLRRGDESAPEATPTLIDQTQGGMMGADLARAGQRYAAAHRESLPLAYDRWPKKKSTLVGLSSVHPPQSVTAPDEVSPTGPVFALWDRAWDVNRGPSNWPLWRRSANDARLVEGPEVGGGAGLGVAGGVGGGNEPFRVADYDLHYAPAVVIGREQQPWCTERFGANKAACIYQMYLAGAEMWVMPDEWAFTLEVVDAKAPEPAPADKLQSSIASRLYSKFHQEACMHYGREFLSLDQWSSDRAGHLRATCAKVLASWGMGAADS